MLLAALFLASTTPGLALETPVGPGPLCLGHQVAEDEALVGGLWIASWISIFLLRFSGKILGKDLIHGALVLSVWNTYH